MNTCMKNNNFLFGTVDLKIVQYSEAGSNFFRLSLRLKNYGNNEVLVSDLKQGSCKVSDLPFYTPTGGGGGG